MVTTTTQYSFQKPTVGDDEDVWGGYLNSNFDSIDSLLRGATSLSSLSLTGNITFGDNDKAIFGAGSDLQIYHDGTGSKIYDSGTGNLQILGDNDVYIANAGNSEYKARFITNGAVELFYDSVKKLATTSTGVDITGTLTSDGLTVDGTNDVALITTNQSNYTEGLTLRNTANWGYGTSLSFESITSSGGSNAEVGRITSTWNTTGRHGLDFYTLNNNTLLRHMRLDGYGDFSLYEDTGTTAKFFWDASAESLGIGTSSPTRTLTVNGTAHFGSTDCGITATDNAGVASVYGLNAAGTTYKPVEIRTGVAGTGFYQTTSGEVGIGTSSPASKFQVKQSAVADLNGLDGIRIEHSSGSTTAYAGLGLTGTDLTIAAGNGSTNNNNILFRTAASGAEAERMRIDSSGNVIINGTVEGYTDYADLLTLSNTSGRAGMTIRSANTSSGNIFFSDVNANSGSDAYVGFLQYYHNVNALLLGTGSAERMRIDGSGNLLVGKTSTSFSTEGVEVRPDSLWVTRDGDTPVFLNRLTSDGSLLSFSKDGTTVGTIRSSYGDRITVGTGDTGMMFRTSSRSIDPADPSTGLITDNLISLGRSGVRFKDLYLAGSVKIGSEVILQESTDRADLLQITSTTSTWGGLQIRNSSNEGRWSFMTDGEAAGIFNDEDGQWHMYMNENGSTYLYYAGANKITTQSWGASVTGVFIADAVAEDYDALSGTTPTCNIDNAGAFSLTMTGNTTFTFSGADNGYSNGFILQLTGNGGTVTWPTSVDWAGGTAPDAPASGETDIYVFWTRDGGTTWYGVHSIDAAS